MEAASQTEAEQTDARVDLTVDWETEQLAALVGEKAEAAERRGERQEVREEFELRAERKEEQPEETPVGMADEADDVDCSTPNTTFVNIFLLE